MVAKFDIVSFVIAFLLGMIITILLVWISYFTRSFIFTYCSSGPRMCSSVDYHNDPGDAIINSKVKIEDTLFLSEQDEMFYKRVPNTNECVTQHTQTVFMKYPQYCNFSDDQVTNTYRQTAFNSNIYEPIDNYSNDLELVTTEGSCVPIPNSRHTKGKPILKWDANPIS